MECAHELEDDDNGTLKLTTIIRLMEVRNIDYLPYTDTRLTKARRDIPRERNSGDDKFCTLKH